MDSTDKKIMEHELAQPIGKAVSAWCKKNNIDVPVSVYSQVMRPTLYVDETGVSHSGNLIIIDVQIKDDDDFDFDD